MLEPTFAGRDLSCAMDGRPHPFGGDWDIDVIDPKMGQGIDDRVLHRCRAGDGAVLTDASSA